MAVKSKILHTREILWFNKEQDLFTALKDGLSLSLIHI